MDRISTFISGALVIILSGISFAASGLTDAYLCEHCVDSESARQRATQLAPGLQCSSSGPPSPDVTLSPDMECWAPDTRIILGNPHDLEIYAVDVSYDDFQPWLISTTLVSLPFDEDDAYRRALEFYNRLIELFPMSSTVQPVQTVLDEDDGLSCPGNTAFDHTVQPALEAQMKQEIKSDVIANLDAFLPQNAWWQGLTFGLTKRGKSALFRMPTQESAPEHFSAKTFMDSEIDTAKPDMLVYSITNIVTNSDRSKSAMDVNLDSSKSRVFGIDLDDVFSGAIDIDNACVLEKLEQLEDDGIADFFSLGGVRVDPHQRFGTGGGNTSPSSGCFRTLRMEVNGEDQGTIRVPC